MTVHHEQLKFGERGLRRDLRVGNVRLSQYSGKFNGGLQVWAANREWVVFVAANPTVPQNRSGPTPRLALENFKKTAQEQVAALQAAIAAADNALSELAAEGVADAKRLQPVR